MKKDVLLFFLKSFLCLYLLIAFIIPLPAWGAVTAKQRLEMLEQIALKGDVHAQYRLGLTALKGTQGKNDPGAAEKWFRMAAEQDHGDSLYGLAILLERKVQTFENEVEVARLYERAAAKGIKRAQYTYALYILNERAGLKKNMDAVTSLMEKAAGQGHGDAKYTLIAMAIKNQYPREKGKTLFYSLKNLANTGDISAIYNMGLVHEYGYFTPIDYEKAATWYKKAFKKGYSFAAGKLAPFYEKGQGVKPNNEKAAFYYKIAAENGHLPSMTGYALALIDGRGIEQNDSAAAAWFNRAAEMGDADAQYFLAQMYREGRVEVTPEKKDQIAKWIKIARGRPWDPDKVSYRMAKHWYKMAADQGHEAAAKELKRDNKLKGWFMLGLGIFFIPFSLAGFLWPDIVAPGRNQFAAKFIGAPLVLVIAIFMIVEGIKHLNAM